MSDEVLPVAATPAATTQPAAPAPVASPSAEAPAPVAAAVTPSAVEPAAAPAETKPSLLSTAQDIKTDAPAEVKSNDNAPVVEPAKTDAPVVADKAPEPKKEEGKQSDEPAPLPTYEAFKIPEGFTLSDPKLSEFTKDLGEFQLRTKADQVAVQEFGQKLLDRYAADIQRVIKEVGEQNKSAREKETSSWLEKFEKDPELGGNRRDTTLKSAAKAMSHIGDEAQLKEFKQMLDVTGAGNHPSMIRALTVFDKIITGYKEKYESESGVKPLPGKSPEIKVTSKVAKRYGGTN